MEEDEDLKLPEVDYHLLALSKDAHRALLWLAREEGVDAETALRRSISLNVFLQINVNMGKKVILYHEKTGAEEITFL